MDDHKPGHNILDGQPWGSGVDKAVMTAADLALVRSLDESVLSAFKQARDSGTGFVRIKYVATVQDSEVFEVDAPSPDHIIVTTPTL